MRTWPNVDKRLGSSLLAHDEPRYPGDRPSTGASLSREHAGRTSFSTPYSRGSVAPMEESGGAATPYAVEKTFEVGLLFSG